MKPTDGAYSQSENYDECFNFFLAHTDEKRKTIAWLRQFVEKLPSRKQFVDVGAGNGALTQVLAPYFAHTAAVEPNLELRRRLQEILPEISVHPHLILEVEMPLAQADFIVCSHVLYYVEQAQWLAQIEKLATWLAPGGALVLMLQHHSSDCMKMHAHFFQHTFDLGALVPVLRARLGHKYQVDAEVLPANIVTPDLPSTCRIAEFMLKLLPDTCLPPQDEVVAYIQRHFRAQGQGHRFSTDQIIVTIRQSR
jgi:SAM-dependent methyltransferase